jgi:hypothetical protein
MELFTVDDIKKGIKKLESDKAEDIDELQAKFLKWGVELLAPHIKEIFNEVIYVDVIGSCGRYSPPRYLLYIDIMRREIPIHL